jgi:hypothetical protein
MADGTLTLQAPISFRHQVITGTDEPDVVPKKTVVLLTSGYEVWSINDQHVSIRLIDSLMIVQVFVFRHANSQGVVLGI